MALDWTTFGLEIVNFLVLAWLLKRFLYRPVVDAVARRRAEIERSMSEARAQREQAESLATQYRNRLADWESEKERGRVALRGEIEAERARQVAALGEALDRERLRRQAVERHEAEERAREVERMALRQGAAFAGRMLAQLAGPDLEARILDLVPAELSRLPDERRAALRAAAKDAGAAVVTSAYPLAEPQRNRIASALRSTNGGDVACEFRRDEHLLAGLRIEVGPWVMRASLQDELTAFAEAGDGTA